MLDKYFLSIKVNQSNYLHALRDKKSYIYKFFKKNLKEFETKQFNLRQNKRLRFLKTFHSLYNLIKNKLNKFFFSVRARVTDCSHLCI